MKIYIKDEMIIDTEQVSCFKVLKKTKYDFQLIAFCGGEAIVLESYDDIDIIQNDLSIIMHHLYIGTEFLDLNNGMPYNDSEF
ncbi:MAG: hypothetical protein ACLUFX_00485 [Oscillospiraceae bacterium]|jgi:hypothetical protein|nr:hypothetical protein [Ruminococcus sp.]